MAGVLVWFHAKVMAWWSRGVPACVVDEFVVEDDLGRERRHPPGSRVFSQMGPWTLLPPHHLAWGLAVINLHV